MWHWLLDVAGVASQNRWYNFWSAFGSDLGEYTIAGAVMLGVVHSIRHHNCHITGCWRIGRHTVQVRRGGGNGVGGLTAVVCRHHHPRDSLTVEDLHSGD